jgi:hypothetical protein
LVLAGASEKHKRAAEKRAGRLAEWPVVFAVRPRIQSLLSRNYLDDASSAEGPAPVNADQAPESACWYKYLDPPALPGLAFKLVLSSDLGSFSAGSHVCVEIEAHRDSKFVGQLQLVLNHDGGEVDLARSPDDSWTANNEKYYLPDPSVFQLRDTPPPLGPTTRPAK